MENAMAGDEFWRLSQEGGKRTASDNMGFAADEQQASNTFEALRRRAETPGVADKDQKGRRQQQMAESVATAAAEFNEKFRQETVKFYERAREFHEETEAERRAFASGGGVHAEAREADTAATPPQAHDAEVAGDAPDAAADAETMMAFESTEI